ncbi:MerR family transcriptional regulator [Nocardia sp. NPDC051756]|uniref:MerR family transcriptional regulator n=1 Tax=Nocardia sp. NPDC051756 TaxID=3154751 RepID=UPI003430123D
MSAGLRTGEVAAAAGVNIQTLRYYERRGLLAEPNRSLGGHRPYPEQTVATLRVIKAAQRLGFTLDEVADLLQVTRIHSRAGLHTRAATKLAEVDAKLAELSGVRDTLRAALAAGCDDLLACSESPCCPIPFTGETSAAGDRRHGIGRENDLNAH